jgi:hypothetical protein
LPARSCAASKDSTSRRRSESRIYGGIHYRFDQTAGQQIGRSVAEFVAANFMKPRRGWDD